MTKDDGQGATTYQCPDCGQVRTGEECEGCVAMKNIREAAAGLWRYFDIPRLLSAFDFQKARAEKAERELREINVFLREEKEKAQRHVNRPRNGQDRHFYDWARGRLR